MNEIKKRDYISEAAQIRRGDNPIKINIRGNSFPPIERRQRILIRYARRLMEPKNDLGRYSKEAK